jgi:F0F1-type ATP synthase assembly protein I
MSFYGKENKREKIKLISFYCFIFVLFKCFDRWDLMAFIIKLFYGFLSVLMLQFLNLLML